MATPRTCKRDRCHVAEEADLVQIDRQHGHGEEQHRDFDGVDGGVGGHGGDGGTEIKRTDRKDEKRTEELSSFWSELLNVIIAEELLPVPMALGYTAEIVPNLLELYGYSDYGGLNNNPNGYSSYQTGFRGRYLSYGDVFAGEE